jgi:hypothetical protein
MTMESYSHRVGNLKSAGELVQTVTIFDTEEREAEARALWNSLTEISARGEKFLCSFGIAPKPLVEAGLVRFWGEVPGDPVVQLFDPFGRLANLVRWSAVGGVAHWSSTEGSLVESIVEVAKKPGGPGRRKVVLPQGIADSIAAIQAFPESFVVLGAFSAEHLESVATFTAPRLAAARGEVLVVVPRDTDDEVELARRRFCERGMSNGSEVRVLRPSKGFTSLVETVRRVPEWRWREGQ